MYEFNAPGHEQFYSPFEILTFAVSPDESKIVMSCDMGGQFNLWCFEADHPFPYPITSHNQHCDAIHIHTDERSGDTVVFFTADKNGDEAYQLYWVAIEGGSPAPVRESEGKRFFLAGMSSDGRRLYYASNKDRPMYLNLYRYNLEDDTEEIVYEGNRAANYLTAVSPDEETFAIATQFGRTNWPTTILHKGDLIPLVPNPEQKHVTRQVQFVDDANLLLLTNNNAEYGYLASFDMATKTFHKLFGIDGQEFHMMARNPASGDVFVVAAQGVVDRLYRFFPHTGDYEEIALPVDCVHQLTATATGNLYLFGSSTRVPHNIYRFNPKTGWIALTNNRVAGCKTEQLVDPEVLHYPSYDGRMIEALYYTAHGEASNGHTIVWPHGGPQYTERKVYMPVFQYFAKLGYNIFCPNFRGSEFYGATFHKLVEQDWGGGPRQDIVRGVEWLIHEGLAKRGKLFLFGGSYGGYMVLLLLGRHGELFKACVDLFGPTNLLTFVEHVPDYWKPRMEAWVGHPERDRDKLIAHSSITYVSEMNKPLMVYQGANDARVGKSESDQIVEALQSRGIDVKYVVFNDAGHAFDKALLMQMDRETAEFFAQYL